MFFSMVVRAEWRWAVDSREALPAFHMRILVSTTSVLHRLPGSNWCRATLVGTCVQPMHLRIPGIPDILKKSAAFWRASFGAGNLM